MRDALGEDFRFYSDALKGSVGDFKKPISTSLEPELKQAGCIFKLKPFNSKMERAGTRRVGAVEVGKSADGKIIFYALCLDYVKDKGHPDVYGDTYFVKVREKWQESCSG